MRWRTSSCWTKAEAIVAICELFLKAVTASTRVDDRQPKAAGPERTVSDYLRELLQPVVDGLKREE